ncbi:MAG: hypothetical protein JWN04_6458 [Myxococcaceae bacterium]|nr:hypothetical protein [Myxococcaceae bacterium]
MTVQPSQLTDTVKLVAPSHGAPMALQLALTRLNRERLSPATPSESWRDDLLRVAQEALREGAFLESERRAIAAQAALAPTDRDGFVAWFEELRETGPGQFDPLFDYLAERAPFEQVRWFVQQEVAGEAGFDDLVALTQLRLPEPAKLELARNYWDEMGRGKPVGMHGPMLMRLADAMGVRATDPSRVVWEALAVGNVLAGLAYNRRYAWHSFGALGAVELTAPTRALKVVQALERVGIEREAVHYFRLHSTVDVVHWAGWRDEALIPLLDQQPQLTRPIAEGALMRLAAGARSFERYRREFGLDPRLQG